MRHSVLIAVVVACLSVGATMADHELSVHCLSVGKGDCTVIVSPDGKVMMVDAGRASAAHNAHVCNYLTALGITTIDHLVITHYHQDHIGGVDTLLKHGITIGAVYDRGWMYCTEEYMSEYIPAIKCVRNTVNDGDTIKIEDSVIAKVVSVNGNGVFEWPFLDGDKCKTKHGHQENAYSVSLLIEYGRFSLFVGGDLTGYDTLDYKDIESSVAAEVGSVDVYQVNHHGSKYSTNPFFLSTLAPTVSILSVGKDTIHHPDPDVLNRLNAVTTVYRTGNAVGGISHGDIVIRTDGIDFYVVQEVDTFPLPVTEIHYPPLPNSYTLSQNYPNPFNSTTTIRYSLPRRSDVLITIYNVLGQRVATLSNGMQSAGLYEVKWDGTNDEGEPVTSGFYTYRIRAEQFTESKKMVLLK